MADDSDTGDCWKTSIRWNIFVTSFPADCPTATVLPLKAGPPLMLNRMPYFAIVAVLLTLLSALQTQAGEALDPSLAARTEGDTTLWYDVELLGPEGKAFDDTLSYYDRLPERAKGVVRDAVWNLSRHSAGMCVRFETDATTIFARWTLTSERLAMPHMAAVGVSGLDLYVRADDGRWRWLAAAAQRSSPPTPLA